MILITLQVVLLIQFINHTNRKIAYFFESVKNEDFTLRFPEQVHVKSLKELNRSLNMLNEKIQEIHLKNQAQEKYYQEILKQADIGIFTLNKKGHILFANSKMEKLLNYKPLNHIKQLNQIDTKLYNLFSNLKPFDCELVQLTNEREKKQISLKSTSLLLNNEEILLVVAQDIHKELDEKETSSWIKLIRVLTHEIMNTVTPITSISDSIVKYFKTDSIIIEANQIDENTIKNTVKGLEVIKEQSGDLMAFVQSYRSFLNLPTPDKSIVSAKRLLDKVLLLMNPNEKSEAISFEVNIKPIDLELFVDEKQISQVLINVIKNALQSLKGNDEGHIKITAGINSNKKKFIEISDNGSGIQPNIIDEIFVPFFTTKEKGTGIGLSLSKQILHLHGGNLNVISIPYQETSFLLLF
ncbi:sensor histidine kinase [Yeosuana marina]|uniref:sensor histidine kinase n=1 Tax=Yeosuana marina TaxID=1565536 RepID=UPI001F0FC3E6|nr:ATP-binding protein [Yeosuana marina]